GRERKGDGLAGWKTGKKERRQRTPADVAFIFRGTSAQKPNRLNEAANKRIPRQRERFRRGWWTAGKEPYADPRLSPRGLPNPASIGGITDETGWNVAAQLRWLWVAVSEQVTFCDILPGRGFDEAASILGADYKGWLTHDGWQVYYKFLKAGHQSCLNHLLD